MPKSLVSAAPSSGMREGTEIFSAGAGTAVPESSDSQLVKSCLNCSSPEMLLAWASRTGAVMSVAAAALALARAGDMPIEKNAPTVAAAAKIRRSEVLATTYPSCLPAAPRSATSVFRDLNRPSGSLREIF